MARRKLHINGKIWEYSIGRENIKYKGPNNESGAFDICILLGITPDQMERARWKGYAHIYQIKPSMIKERLIEEYGDKK